jgi:uncharacterized protein (DUF427 family)
VDEEDRLQKETAMAISLGQTFLSSIGELRFEPTTKRIRALVDGETILDSEDALLVWEPRRVVPTFAIRDGDFRVPVIDSAAQAHHESPRFDRVPVWDPRVPFAVREGTGRDAEIQATARSVAGFRSSDPVLAGYVIIDFAGPDEWLEEDDAIVSHPHSPFSRIDIRESSKHIEISIDGVPVADTTRARILFETGLPRRFYLPADDVIAALEPSATTSVCAYKGTATYFSPVVNDSMRPDLVWVYENPLIDAVGVKDYLAFFDEKVDVAIDGVPVPRPVTPWS